jgi:hypothetical protein
MHWHVLQNQCIEHCRIAIFQMGQVDIFLDILILGIELRKASKFVNGRIECQRDQSMRVLGCCGMMSLDGHVGQRREKFRLVGYFCWRGLETIWTCKSAIYLQLEHHASWWQPLDETVTRWQDSPYIICSRHSCTSQISDNPYASISEQAGVTCVLKVMLPPLLVWCRVR